MKKDNTRRNVLAIVIIAIVALIIFFNGTNLQAHGPSQLIGGETDDSIENKYTEVHGYHILVATEQEAFVLKEQIDDGADFNTLAEEYSTCPSGQSGGDLDWFGRGAMVSEFDEAAFSLEVDEISDPVQTQFGWHLILIAGKR